MGNKLKVVIFGASGKTGKLLVHQALELGYQVTAFVRNPDKLPVTHDSLSLFQGDALAEKDIDKVVAGQDAVLMALGVNPGQKPVCLEGAKNVIAAMKKHSVSRLVVISAYGVADSNRGFYARLLWLVIRSLMQDKEDLEHVLADSDLDWVAVRPTILTSGPETGAYQTGECLNVGFFPRISRGDVANFMLECVVDDKYLHKYPTITG